MKEIVVMDRRKGPVSIVVVAAAGTILLAGCGAASPSAATSEPTATTSDPAFIPPADPTTPAPAPAPARTPSTPRTSARPSTKPLPTVTGWGATLTAWRSAHVQLSGAAKDRAFGPIVDGQEQGKYAAVEFYPDGSIKGDSAPPDHMLVTGYDLVFPKGTSEQVAMPEAMAEYPPDARIVQVSHSDGTCKLFLVHSAILDRQLAVHAMSGWKPFFELESDPGGGTYSPAKVSDDLVGILSPGDSLGLGGC